MKKNVENNQEMQTLFDTINELRISAHPEISEKLLTEILEIEKNYVNFEDKAHPEIKKLIDKELERFD